MAKNVLKLNCPTGFMKRDARFKAMVGSWLRMLTRILWTLLRLAFTSYHNALRRSLPRGSSVEVR
jgi:hypothetical protein